MADAAVGEIRIWAGTTFVPNNWYPCDGRQLKISQYPELYSLIGVTYGGDGATYFCLPDFRGRLPVGQGISPESPTRTSYVVGGHGGTETVTVSASNLPAHNHTLSATSAAANSMNPAGAWLGAVSKGFYAPVPSATDRAKFAVTMNAVTMLDAYGNSNHVTQPHNNIMSSLGIGFIICMRGFYPDRP